MTNGAPRRLRRRTRPDRHTLIELAKAISSMHGPGIVIGDHLRLTVLRDVKPDKELEQGE
ncbi:hypothetical protein [Nonomuraea sp. NPDC003709]|uniref:hypothetical protein n=1 Tax=Nonomuraea sp. NPDC003709 TaxID=3154450 RepID=UPI0033AAC496